MPRGELDQLECMWFRLEIHREDLPKCVHLSPDLGDDIAFFEGLAQVVLLVLRCEWGHLHGGMVKQLCDNAAVVGAARKGLSTAEPLCRALQCWAGWEHRFDMRTSVDHVAGEQNVLADALSRWRKKRHLLQCLDVDKEVSVDLKHVLEPLVAMCP